MNKLSSGIENEKSKEAKEETEEESYEEYENAAEEGVEEGWLPENGFPSFISQSTAPTSQSECETFESSLKSNYADRKELLLRERWFTITGKKPRNIPIVQTIADENAEEYKFFGERKPLEVEKQRNEKIVGIAKKLQALRIQYGKIRQEIHLQSLNRGVMALKFSSDGNYLAFSERFGGIQVRQISTNKIISKLKTEEEALSLPVNTLVFHPENIMNLYAGGECGAIRVFNVQTGTLLGVVECLDEINVMDINANGSYIATGGKNGKVNVIDGNTLQPIWSRGCSDLETSSEPSVNDAFHRLRIYGLKFHPTEINNFVTGGWDHFLKIWDVRVPKAIRSISGPAIYGTGVDITDNIILTASWRAENSLSLWDFSSGELIKNIPINNKSIKMEGEFLYTAQFFKNYPSYVSNNLIAVGGSGFPEMLILNVYTEKVEKYFPSYKVVHALDIFQNLIAYGGKESILRIAEITPPPGRG